MNIITQTLSQHDLGVAGHNVTCLTHTLLFAVGCHRACIIIARQESTKAELHDPQNALQMRLLHSGVASVPDRWQISHGDY